MLVRSAAKVNLTLDVLGRRDDGYHELQSVVHTVGLWDELAFRFGSSARCSIECDAPGLAGEDNLCVRAANAWVAEARRRHPAQASSFGGAQITLRKHIPTGAGLGGGSGNAAATLLAFNRFQRNVLDEATLARIAVSLGADVPFFLRAAHPQGGCALMEGVGERLNPLPALRGWLLIVRPATELSTPQVYAAWDALHASAAPAAPSGRATASATLRRMLESAPLESAPPDADAAAQRFPAARLANVLHNDLGRAAQECGVAVTEMIGILKGCGALGASMTGSGSAVFGVFDTETAARRALESLRASQSALRDVSCAVVAPLCTPGIEFAPP